MVKLNHLLKSPYGGMAKLMSCWLISANSTPMHGIIFGHLHSLLYSRFLVPKHWTIDPTSTFHSKPKIQTSPVRKWILPSLLLKRLQLFPRIPGAKSLGLLPSVSSQYLQPNYRINFSLVCIYYGYFVWSFWNRFAGFPERVLCIKMFVGGYTIKYSM